MFPQSVPIQTSSGRRKGRRVKARSGQDDVAQDTTPATVGVGGVEVDFGRPGGARLAQHDGRWGWDWAVKHDPRTKLRASTTAVELYPGEKRPVPKVQDITVKQQVSAVTTFLEGRLGVYDHLGVKDLIAQEIEDSFAHPSLPRSQSLPALPSDHDDGDDNAHDGNAIAVLRCTGKRAIKGYICFPTGPLGESLNVSPLLGKSNGRLVPSAYEDIVHFIPTSQPAVTFPTPIMQIESSPSAYKGVGLDEALSVVVRLQSETHFLHAIPRSSYITAEDTPTTDVEKIGCLRPSDTAGLRHADIALDPQCPGRTLVVDECGGVWLWTETRVRTGNHRFESRMQVTRVRQSATTTRNSFYRIAWSIVHGHAIILSRRSMVLLNLETGVEKTMLEVQGKGRVFTSMDKSAVERGACYTAAATTYEVIWVEEHGMKPVLSWTHEYRAGLLRDLEVTAVHGADEGCLLLSSRSSRMVMVVHGPAQPPAQAPHHPYALLLPNDLPTPLTSLSTLGATEDKSRIILLGTASNGGLWSSTIAPLGVAGDMDADQLHVSWTQAIKDKADVREQGDTRAKLEEDSFEDVAETQHKELDLRWAWLDINEAAEEAHASSPGDFATDTPDLHFRSDHPMTAAELARDKQLGDTSATRSRALRPLYIDTPTPDPAATDIGHHLVLVAEYDAPHLDDYVPSLPLRVTDAEQRSAKHKTDHDRLAADLRLSRHVYYSTPLAPPPASPLPHTQTTSLDTPEDLFARVSLNDKEPPPITFSFFNRHPHVPEPHGPTQSADPASLSARHLLSEWQLGSDPGAYAWKAWRDPAEAPDPPPTRPIRPLPNLRSPIKPAIARAPPTVQTVSASQPARPRTELRPAESMPTSFRLPPAVARSSPPPMPRSSQDFGFAQTQVEPGKFGGRAGGTKKKVKKRVGGF